MKKGIATLVLFLLSSILVGSAGATEACISCHQTITPGIVADYQQSKMAEAGVGCLDCHSGVEGDPSVREHNGFKVTPVVSPKVCGKCHPDEVKEFRESLHDEAALFAMSAYGTEGDERIDHNAVVAKNKNYKTNFARESAN